MRDKNGKEVFLSSIIRVARGKSGKHFVVGKVIEIREKGHPFVEDDAHRRLYVRFYVNPTTDPSQSYSFMGYTKSRKRLEVIK